jgi:hypothetical protein
MGYGGTILIPRSPHGEPYIIRVIKSRRMRWPGHVARMGKVRSAHKIVVGNGKGNRLLGRPRHRWEDIIRMDRKEVRWESVDWMPLTQDRDQWRTLVSTLMDCLVP